MQTSAIAKIESLLTSHFGNEVFTPGLARINTWIERYQLLPTQAKIVTIAGTNGKGETTHCLGFLLTQSKVQYVQWTSPHILQITERFIANGSQISGDDLLALVEKWLVRIADNPDAPLSYYEFLFVVFLDWQRTKAAKVILLEVGLGGRLDAVNALDASVVILTSISRDHQEFLGRTYRQILREKLGVLRSNARLISSLETSYLKQKTKEIVDERNALWDDLPRNLNASDFSSINQSLAYAAFQKLQLGSLPLEILNQFHYANRFEYHLGQADFYLVGSHNPDGLRKLVQFLDRHHYNKYDVVLLSFSKRDEKDLVTMAKAASCLSHNIWISTFAHNKAVEFERLKLLLNNQVKGRLNFVTDQDQALSQLSQTPQKVLVTGSYYFIGEVYSRLQRLGTGR